MLRVDQTFSQSRILGSAKASVVFFAFDILMFAGRDVRSLPLIERQQLLRQQSQWRGMRQGRGSSSGISLEATVRRRAILPRFILHKKELLLCEEVKKFRVAVA